ncbi:MAG: tetratricopeptide repeat protein [Chloroflexota bacterium]
MLTLHLTLTNQQVTVRVNGQESHQFPLLDLSQTKAEWTDFFNNPRLYGEKLFNALFRDAAKIEFDALSKQSERTIVLVLESSELDVIAWEYAYNKAREEYVVEDCAFVRALPENERPANGRLKNEVERVPLLFIPANPLVDLSGEPMRALDVDGEWREMKRQIEKSNAPFDMIELRPATPEALQSVMARFQKGMIAHFSGHGAATKDGAILLFERENGASNPLEAREFVREIKDKAWIGFLSACQSAAPERTEFSNLARELAKAGVSFALGMQFNLPDPFAPNISGQFYNYLAHGHPVPEAARQARRTVKRENEFFVGMIALYAAQPDEVRKLAWHGTGAQTLNLFRPADVSDLPSPASGLIGRQRELMRIGTRLLEGKKPLTVTLHGAGGIGKTALLHEALLRFAPSFELTLAIGLDTLPSLESVLGRIERFLGLPLPCANDTKEREVIVRNALTSKRTLLGLDNFETLNHALNDEATKGTAKSLYAFFKSLPATGVTLCVTSREKTNLPGEHIEEIYGLEDTMGGALFYENVSTRKDALNGAGLEKLSSAIGGHPLALRLLAPIFEEQAGLSLEQFIEKLQTFLPKASDQWTEQERHESLGACFAFSMDNLPKNEEGKRLQVAISRLSLFIAYFMAITAMPVIENGFPETEDDGKELATHTGNSLHALWERGLLERAVIPLEEENFYLYRVHPALRLFAKDHLTDSKVVIKNYRKSLHMFAEHVQSVVTKNPLLMTIAFYTISDLINAANLEQDETSADMKLLTGTILRNFGQNDAALELFEKAVIIYNSLGENNAEARAQYATTDIYKLHGNLDRAMMILQGVVDTAEETSDMKLKSDALSGIAEILAARGNLDDAIIKFQQSLVLKEAVGDLRGKSIVLGELAKIQVIRGNLEKGLELQKEKLSIVRETGDIRDEATALHEIGRILTTRGELDNAMDLFKQAHKIYKSLGYEKGRSAALIEIAKILRVQGNLTDSIELFEQSILSSEKQGDLQFKGIALHEMGLAYFALGKSQRAMELFQQSLEIDEKLGDMQGKAATLGNLAGLYFQRGDLNTTMDLCLQSLKIVEDLGDVRGKANALGVIGKVYWASQKYRDAIKFLLEGLMQLVELEIDPRIQQIMISDLIRWRQELGTETFDALWLEEIGQPLPEWLTQQSEQSQGMTVEQFIAGAIQSAREKRPEAEEYFKSAQEMAADASVPAEMRELGRVLQRIMLGDGNVDLSSLPREWEELIKSQT